MYSAVLFIFLAVSTRHLFVYAQGCRPESGKEILDGEMLKTANPCLECFCVNGKIQCRLKICPPLPRPPPQSCVLLQKPNSCCGKLVCPGKHNEKARSNLETKLEHDSEGCMLNGTLYAEGSAMMSSLCEYCYCIKGKQHCVRPQCTLSVAGCKPEYSKHSCCPTKYNCSNLNAVSSTTTLPSSTASSEGCWSGGVKYPEGERVQAIEKSCENCYCMQGKVRCDTIICNMTHLDHCTPIHNQGHCCPISYNCSNGNDLITTEIGETSTFIETSTAFPESTTPFSTETTTLETFNDTELRSGDDQYERETTTEMLTTLAITTLKSSPTRAIPAVIEAILNRTLEREGDYGEYDYNEPSLPPSLPNLKIIPFVAADAVVNGNEGSELFEQNETKFKTTQEPIYYELPKDSKFSPPSETEGGFLPRDPNIDGPFYESKIETFGNSGEPETTSEVKFPPLTEAPKLFENGQCKTKGRTYHHGEVVSEPKACELCVCYFGKVHCQKAKCDNASQCRTDSCCQCDVPSKVTSPTYIPESPSNLPAITIADVIVTPDPFKDVIRTEPAPDLEHILKDMMPHIEKSKNDIEKNATEKIIEKKNETITTSTPETSTDYEELSFSSVFDLFFNDETKKPFDESNPETNLVVHADERADHFKPNSSDKYDIKYNTTDKNENSDNAIKGLLKLAGCNIYGRMYRVEKIIAELSNPCLECKCTEMGVQCKKLNC